MSGTGRVFALISNGSEPGVVADIGRYYACPDPPLPLRR